MKSNDELWTIKDIAEYLKMSISTVYKNWKKLGVEPVVAYPGAKPRFPRSEVMKAVEAAK
jgi:predicted site-specific integrase-resolvase